MTALNSSQNPIQIYPPRFEQWMITITIMLVAIIEVLDMTIVNVALTPMMGALGATTDQITWVLTSYIVSSAIVMLLTGFLDTRYGRRNLLLVSIIGFMVASILCGTASTLGEIVFFRTLQGIFGGSLVPLSQTILRQTFPKKEQGKAMAIWGIGIMVAPVLGPTLGGIITQHLDWRWVFYINIPVCIIATLMTLRFIKKTVRKKVPIDWLGMFLMATGIGTLQIFLDRGNSVDWFQSNTIIILAMTSVITLAWFIIRGINRENNIINLKIFLDRNFTLSTLMLTLYCVGVLGIISIQPLLLENFMGYPVQTAGLIMAPRGIASAVGMMIVGILISRVDARKLMMIGLFFSIIGTYMMSGYNLLTDTWPWIWSGTIQGFGMGMVFVPLAMISLSTLEEKYIAEGSGLFSFGRNLGISIGISILSTIITRETQINWNRLGAHINPFNINLQVWLQQHNWTLHNPLALGELQRQLALQSGMIAFIDSFWFVAIGLVLLIPLIMILKRPDIKGDMGMMH